MPKKITPLPPRRSHGHRARERELWVNEPLQLAIRDELDRREMSISDLGRAIGSQPSLVSRWMQGQRPNPESIERIARALSLDVEKLMRLAGHLPPKADEADEDEHLVKMFVTMRQITWNDERRHMLMTLLDWMRENEPSTTPNTHPARRESALEQTG
jgi:transcriptional regulator with XRE-family HTH domain